MAQKRAAESAMESKMIQQAPAPAAAPAPPPPKAAEPPPIVYIETARAGQSPTFAPPAEIDMLVTPADEAPAASIADASREKVAQEEFAQEQERSVAQRATRREQAQAAGAPSTAPAAVLSYSRPISAAATDNVATLKRTYTDPEAWLKDIRQLRKDNKQEEADSEWHRFRETFPDYEVAETDAAREVKKQ
jgi:hypothetical protein